jgi:spore germination protein YaaH
LAALVATPVAAMALTLLPALNADAAPEPAPAKIMSGWMPYWTTSSSLATITANKALYSEVSPFWYMLTWSAAGGSSIYQQVSNSSKATAKATLSSLGVAAWPTLTDGMPARRLSAIMQVTATRKKLVSQLVSLAVTEKYQGLDLDFEKFAFSDGSSTWAATRPAWVQFVKELSAGLHANGKKLSVTTPPLCNMNSTCGPTTGYWVYDWKGVGAYADVVRIMAYDYSWTTPGPIGPFGWAEANVKFAVSQMSPGKVELGVPTYGRDWVARDANNKLVVVGTCPTNKTVDLGRHEFDSVNAPSVLAARGLTSKNVVWNNTYKESTFRYNKYYTGTVTDPKTKKPVATTCRVAHEAWYADSRAVVARAGLVGKYKIRGITTWTIGGEDPAQWAPLTAYARSLAATRTGQSLPPVVSTTVAATVHYGAATTVTAVAAAKPAGTAAALQWRPIGSTRWSTVATGKLGAKGVVSWSRKVVASGAFRVSVAGVGLGPVRNVKVIARAVPSVSSTAPRAGTLVRMTVAIAPALAGQTVYLQLWVPSRWVTIATARTDARGHAHFTKIGGRAGSLYTFRGVVASSASIVGTVSPLIRFRTR